MDPATFADFKTRWHTNHRVTGIGLDVTEHMPCPFCAAPNFMVYRIIDTQPTYTRGAVCGTCHRGARALFCNTDKGYQFEFVQTKGPDQPAWIDPPMRRLVITGGLADP